MIMSSIKDYFSTTNHVQLILPILRLLPAYPVFFNRNDRRDKTSVPLLQSGRRTLDWFNFVNSDQGIDDIKGMFLLTSDIDEMEWVPACALLETYPTLSSDSSGSSNVRDGEAELGLSSDLLVSCTENEDVLVAESGIQDCSEEERVDWGYLISKTDVGIDQYQCHFLVSKTGDTQLEYCVQLELL